MAPGFAPNHSLRGFDDAFEGAIIDFHDQELHLAPRAIGALAAYHQPVPPRSVQILPAHAGQFDVDDEMALGDINVRVESSAFAGAGCFPLVASFARNKEKNYFAHVGSL